MSSNGSRVSKTCVLSTIAPDRGDPFPQWFVSSPATKQTMEQSRTSDRHDLCSSGAKPSKRYSWQVHRKTGRIEEVCVSFRGCPIFSVDMQTDHNGIDISPSDAIEKKDPEANTVLVSCSCRIQVLIQACQSNNSLETCGCTTPTT
ncbi:hypothetical protein CHS0354_002749 [Potamilus streckersoni]|uniref:Uncharacterized protein n=1 Tax=Potamilus streckersoni TaxID=2493646 RepID=A0AAE0SJV6_9BIVA|nr:hypothetical protein CHS0354_002749 [Potamilus streckersoni]